MNRNQKPWVVVIGLAVSCFCGRLAVAQTVSEIEVARQSPVVLFKQPSAQKLVADRLGNLYFLDPKAAALQAVNPADGKVSTLFTTEGVIADFFIDVNDNIWAAVASEKAGKILKLSPSIGDYKLTRFSTPVAIRVEGLLLPVAVAVDANGDLYIADAKQHAVLKVHPQGGIPEVIAGNLVNPRRLMVDTAGILYVQDWGLDMVLRYRQGATKAFLPLAGATDMAIDGLGNLYFADETGVRIVSGEGRLQARLPMCPSGPTAVVVSPEGRLFASGEAGIFELPVANTSVFDFGNTILGRDSVGTLAVCNQHLLRTEAAHKLILGITGPNASDFSQSSQILGASPQTGCSAHELPARAVCLLSVRFSPKLTSARSAVLSIISNNVELSIPLAGTGVF